MTQTVKPTGRQVQLPSPHAMEESPAWRHVQDKVGMKEDKELIGE
jgi:hypothetical protein